MHVITVATDEEEQAVRERRRCMTWVISSMDFRSGFWTAEDAVPVAMLARLLEFKQAEEVERYLRHQQHNREQAEFLARRQDAKAYRPLPEHDHVFSSAGKCMWFYCEALDAGAVDWIGR